MRCHGMTSIQKRGLDSIPDIGFQEDVAHMGLDSLGAYEKLIGDLFIGHAVADQFQNLHLTRRKYVQFCRTQVGERLKNISSLSESFEDFLENQCCYLSFEPDLSPIDHTNAFNKLLYTLCESEKTTHPPSIIAITFSSLKRIPMMMVFMVGNLSI